MDRPATLDPAMYDHLTASGLLREGHFAFRSGNHSAALVDRDRLLADPAVASRMGYALAKRFFTDHVETVAAPSTSGAGLAQWVAYFLDPKAKVVNVTPRGGMATIAENLRDLIANRRVLLIDDLIDGDETISRFIGLVKELDGEVVGLGSLWNSAAPSIDGQQVFGLLNSRFAAVPAERCPLCADGHPPAVPVGY